jgi:sulfite exporter TauE/SafE
MKKSEQLLTALSYVLLAIIVILLGVCSSYHLAGEQRLLVICAGIILILFGVVLTIETKIKWLEAEKKSSK